MLVLELEFHMRHRWTICMLGFGFLFVLSITTYWTSTTSGSACLPIQLSNLLVPCVQDAFYIVVECLLCTSTVLHTTGELQLWIGVISSAQVSGNISLSFMRHVWFEHCHPSSSLPAQPSNPQTVRLCAICRCCGPQISAISTPHRETHRPLLHYIGDRERSQLYVLLGIVPDYVVFRLKNWP